VKKFRISKTNVPCHSSHVAGSIKLLMWEDKKEEENSNEPLEPVGMLKLDEMYPGMIKKPLMVHHLEDTSVLLHGETATTTPL